MQHLNELTYTEQREFLVCFFIKTHAVNQQQEYQKGFMDIVACLLHTLGVSGKKMTHEEFTQNTNEIMDKWSNKVIGWVTVDFKDGEFYREIINVYDQMLNLKDVSYLHWVEMIRDTAAMSWIAQLDLDRTEKGDERDN